MASTDRAPARLQAEQMVGGRPFTDPANTAADCATLDVLQATLTQAAWGGRAAVLRFADKAGEHHVVVPDWEALTAARPAAMVGFFGQARDDVGHEAISALEHAIVSRARAFPGLLAYHNARLASGQWGNLVVFRSSDDTERVTGDPLHASAVALTPQHYRSLRLHRGALTDGCLGGAPAVVVETLYLDFEESPVWRALRTYA